MKKNQSGFSMVEVITAMVIVSVLAAGVFATTSFSKRMDVITQQKLIAMSKVEERMNSLKHQGAASLAATLDVTPPPDQSNLCYSNNCTPNISELNGTMKVSVSTIVKAVPADPNAKEVIVRADWKDSLGAVRTQSAATYMQG